MRLHRRGLVSGLFLASALTIGAAAPAHAGTPGVGASTGGIQLLHLRVGDGALDLQVGTESSATSNDPAAGPPSAVERLAPLQVSSTLLPAVNALSLPAIEVASTGEERSAATPAVDLGALSSSTPVPGLLDGSVGPLSLRAVVDAAGSIADATGGVSGVSVLGGLLNVGELSALLGSDALIDGAGAARSVSLDRVEVLDLDALLQLLGLDIDDLSLEAAAGLLAALGVQLPGGATSPAALVATVESLLAQAGSVPAQIDALGDQLVAAQGQLATLTSDLSAAQAAVAAACGVIPLPGCAAAQATVTALQGQIASVNAQIASLTAQIDALLDSVAALLAPIFDIIGGLVVGLTTTPLLALEGVSIGVVAEAVDTVEGSIADVTASIGAVRVGTLTIPGTDLLALADQVTATIGGVLSVLDPALGGLIDVDLLTEATSVRAEGTRTIAEASLVAARVTITPPDLCGLLSRLGATAATDTIGGLLTSLGQTVPPLPIPVNDVLGDLGSILSCTAGAAGQVAGAQLVGGVVAALTQPLTLDLLTVSGQSAFTPAVTQTPGAPATPGGSPTLPRTGGELPLALAAVAIVAGLGARRVLALARVR